jgi:hypothetical protein
MDPLLFTLIWAQEPARRRAHPPAGAGGPSRAVGGDGAEEPHPRLFPGRPQGALSLPSLYVVMETQHIPTSSRVTASGRDVPRHDNTRPTRATAATGRAPPGMLGLSIRRWGSVIDLGLSGDLDMATAPRLGEAMAWLRISGGPATTIVINTTALEFIAAAGYRALRAALVGPDGLWDARVSLIMGPAVARLEAAVSASALRRRHRSPVRRGGGAAG